MKNIYKFLFAILFLIVIKNSCKALSYGGCDYTTVATIKKLVSNVNISYTYEIKNNVAYFNVTLNNIPENILFVDSNTSKNYTYNDTNNGEITISDYSDIQEGQYKFYVNNNICNGIKLGSKYYKFPLYNTRYNSNTCKDIPNFTLCKKWISKYYNDYEFEGKVNEYKNSLKTETIEEKNIKYEKDFISTLVEFYIKYYYYLLPLVIIVLGAIVFISKRKDRFKL